MIVKYTNNFLKQLKKSDVRIRKAFKQCLLLFVENPNELELNNHPLQREYAGFRSIDITADYRAIYKETLKAHLESFLSSFAYKEVIQEDGTYIYFTSFGTHSQLYGN